MKCCVEDLRGRFDAQAPPGDRWRRGRHDIVLMQCELSLLFVINLPFKVFFSY